MNRPLLILACALCLSTAATSNGASTDIRFWPHKHKDPAAAPTAPKPKAKGNFLHRGKSSRAQAARSEAANGMPGPKSVGWRHPQPGPAGFGAR